MTIWKTMRIFIPYTVESIFNGRKYHLLMVGSILTLFGMGGPLAKILNNTKFGQAEGLPELFTEQNLVLHVF